MAPVATAIAEGARIVNNMMKNSNQRSVERANEERDEALRREGAERAAREAAQVRAEAERQAREQAERREEEERCAREEAERREEEERRAREKIQTASRVINMFVKLIRPMKNTWKRRKGSAVESSPRIREIVETDERWAREEAQRRVEEERWAREEAEIREGEERQAREEAERREEKEREARERYLLFSA